MTGVLVELSEADALAFREYMRIKDTLDVMTQAGVFSSRSCEARLNFNDDGVLTKIRYVTTGWTRKSPPQVVS
jgi:hypothetical protein